MKNQKISNTLGAIAITFVLAGFSSFLKGCGIKEWVIYKIVLEPPEVIIVDCRSHH